MNRKISDKELSKLVNDMSSEYCERTYPTMDHASIAANGSYERLGQIRVELASELLTLRKESRVAAKLLKRSGWWDVFRAGVRP